MTFTTAAAARQPGAVMHAAGAGRRAARDFFPEPEGRFFGAPRIWTQGYFSFLNRARPTGRVLLEARLKSRRERTATLVWRRAPNHPTWQSVQQEAKAAWQLWSELEHRAFARDHLSHVWCRRRNVLAKQLDDIGLLSDDDDRLCSIRFQLKMALTDMQGFFTSKGNDMSLKRAIYEALEAADQELSEVKAAIGRSTEPGRRRTSSAVYRVDKE